MSHSSFGRHENGQNFLTSRAVIGRIVDEVASTTGPILEIGSGGGVLTAPIAATGRPVTAIEIDRRWAARLRRELPEVDVVHGDYLRTAHPRGPHVVVGNLPFHLTTAILRRLLAEGSWTEAVLLTQWEVARRRAGVGGASLLTAQWCPWYEFALLERVPATAFAPRPSVDGGLLRVSRRTTPAVHDRAAYQRLVQRVFTGPGRGLAQVLRRTGAFERAALDRWLRARSPHELPKDLGPRDWEVLWAMRCGAR